MTGNDAIDRLIVALRDQDFTGYQDEAIREEVATLLTMGAFDPFSPDWRFAPDWAQWHTVTPSGEGEWWENPTRAVADGWAPVGGGCEWMLDDDMAGIPMTGLDWRNSLRARPEVQP